MKEMNWLPEQTHFQKRCEQNLTELSPLCVCVWGGGGGGGIGRVRRGRGGGGGGDGLLRNC